VSFSNTIDALRFAPGFTGALDERFVADYLLAGWCLDEERTVYKEIRRLATGHVLNFSSEGLKIRRAAQLPMEQLIQYKRDDEYMEHYRELFERAVKDRLPSEGAVVFMSGGLDSTAVAAVAKRISAGAIRAQAVDYKPLFEDEEGEEARRVAEFLKIPFELLHGGEFELFSGWDTAGFPMPEPRYEPFLALHVESRRKAALSARVALSGDGGDDVLLGQAWPYLRLLMKQGRWRSAAGEIVRHVWNTGTLPVLGLGIRSRIQNRFAGGATPESFPLWVADDFENRLKLRERFTELQRKPASEHPIHPWAYAMLTGPFWPNVLEGEDAVWSGVALETRAPLLDRRLLRFLLRLPTMPWCMNKELVRRTMRETLPRETVERAKTPLARDPVELQVAQGKWSPLPLEEFPPYLREVVDMRRLANCLRSKDRRSLYTNLRPISLGRWLKSVEMKRGIQ
jgi:asparagine synthase (glutamine-hydrolysing)